MSDIDFLLTRRSALFAAVASLLQTRALFAGEKEVITTGKSKVEEQRALLQSGEAFWDDVSTSYLTLDQILVPYLTAVKPVIQTFVTLLREKSLAT